MNTPTKGPWTVEEPMDHELWIVEAGKEAYEWRVIAGLPWPSEKGDISRPEVKANASLISAAPDLLALAYQYADDLRYPPADDSRERRLAAIDAAIAKATARDSARGKV